MLNLNPLRWLALRRAQNLGKASGSLDLDDLPEWQVRQLLSAGGLKAIAAGRAAFEFPVVNLEGYEAYLRAATSKVWCSWKACDITANVTSTLPFKVLRGTGTEGVEVDGLQTLLTYPNETMTFAELVYLTVMHIKMTGNAYWLKSEPVLDGSKPLALYPLNPRRVTLVISRETGELTGYRVSGTTSVTIPADEVIHFKRPHPNNSWYGLGDIEAGAAMMSDVVNRGAWKDAFWKNGATPSGVLVKEDAAPAQELWQKLKQEFMAQYSGVKNSGKVAWLSGKWSVLKLGLTLSEMADIESRKLTTEEVFLLHGVPLSVAGVREAANYATAEIDDVRFRRYTVLPMAKLIEDTINTDLVVGYGEDLRLKFNVTGLVAIGQMVTNLTPAFDRGVVSINEFREIIGLDPDPENSTWNMHFVSAGLVPVELAGIADTTQQQNAAKEIVGRFIAESMAGRNGQPHVASPRQ